MFNIRFIFPFHNVYKQKVKLKSYGRKLIEINGPVVFFFKKKEVNYQLYFSL